MTIKGIEYAMFGADSGSYVASYVTDATAPVVVTRTPAPNATGVPITTTIRAGFSEMLDPNSVGATTVELRNAANALVPATITYLPGSMAIRIVPTAPLQSA